MSELNHLAISAILQSEIVGSCQFGHGQIASLGDAQRHFDLLSANEPPEVRHRNETADTEAVVKAFLAVREHFADQGSVDLYVADPTRNAAFLTECRKIGITTSDYRINKTLLSARKNNHLPKLKSSTTSVDYRKQAFACELAATELRYRTGATIDDILCDPILALEFDDIAQKITPGLTSFEYRWAILSIRKGWAFLNTRKVSQPQALPASYKMPEFGRKLRIIVDSLDRVPETSGVYRLFEKEKLLYLRSTDHLRSDIESHRDPNAIRAITEKLWKPKPEDFLVDYAVITEKKKAYLQALEKKLVEDDHPLFNVPRSAA